jgi:hypothetical protein
MGEKPRVSGTLGMQHEGEIDLLKELLDATLNIPLHAEIGANGKRGKKKKRGIDGGILCRWLL